MSFFKRSILTFLALIFLGKSAAAASNESWKDPVTGKIWHILSQSIYWSDAVTGCEDLDIGGDSSYRLPTLEEWWDAYDRIKLTPLAESLQSLQLKAWTSDPLPGTNPPMIWTLYLQTGNGGGLLAADLASAACIH